VQEVQGQPWRQWQVSFLEYDSDNSNKVSRWAKVRHGVPQGCAGTSSFSSIYKWLTQDNT
jgi:hypothetical protein